MKSQEQRIEDAAKVIARAAGYDSERDVLPHHREKARRILEAADHEGPKWPTDESITAFLQVGSSWRERTRAAMLHDPIIKAAREVSDAWGRPGRESVRYFEALAALCKAVNEAGL